MVELSGRLDVSGHGAARVPIRVETSDGRLVALTTAEQDGSWAVDVPGGKYLVRPRGMAAYTAVSGSETSVDGSGGVPEGSVAATRRARRGER